MAPILDPFTNEHVGVKISFGNFCATKFDNKKFFKPIKIYVLSEQMTNIRGLQEMFLVALGF